MFFEKQVRVPKLGAPAVVCNVLGSLVLNHDNASLTELMFKSRYGGGGVIMTTHVYVIPKLHLS